ncbi:helix-turn-helix domain-containing protein [Streptomyces flavidovirens]
MISATAAGQHTDPHSAVSAVGRRIAHCRTEAGLSVVQLAHAVGADPAYLRHVEQRDLSPGSALLTRIASALGMSLSDLRGRHAHLPEGRSAAAPFPRMETVGQDECWTMLAGHGVGRVAVPGPPLGPPAGPLILPVNYSVVEGRIAYRTSPGTVTASVAGGEVAFEADRIDEVTSAGWNVVAVGPARLVTDAGEAAVLDEHAFSLPWPDPTRGTWIVIRPTRLSGRRIRT